MRRSLFTRSPARAAATLQDAFRTRLGLPNGRIGAIAGVHTSHEKITWNPTTYPNTDSNMVRTDRHKLISYNSSGTQLELYDFDVDPDEHDKLAENPLHSAPPLPSPPPSTAPPRTPPKKQIPSSCRIRLLRLELR